jgi:hypothetical protein
MVLVSKGCVLISSQITLRLRKNARLRDLSRLHRHQRRSLNIPLHLSRKLVHLSRIHPRADNGVAIRGKEATCQLVVSTLTDVLLVAIVIRRAHLVSTAGHHHKLKALSSKDQRLQQIRDDGREARTQFHQCWSRARRGLRRIRSKRKEILSIRLDRR